MFCYKIKIIYIRSKVLVSLESKIFLAHVGLGPDQEDCVMSSTGNSNNLFAPQLLTDHQAGDESILVAAVRELKGWKMIENLVWLSLARK